MSSAKSPTTVEEDLLIRNGPNRIGRELSQKRCLPTASWRFCLVAGAMTAWLVYLINLSVTIWATRTGRIDHKRQGTIYEGSCSTVRNVNIGVHLAINACSTLLLSASNYCMQCLSAPTRREVDNAHVKKIWLDVGAPTFRNLSYISRTKVILWFCFGLSSLPLHLFYNSAFYPSLSVISYDAILVRHAFLDAASPDGVAQTTTQRSLYQSAKSGHLEKLNTTECIRTYKSGLQTHHANVLLVANETYIQYQLANNRTMPSIVNNTFIASNTSASVAKGWNSYDWVCGETSFEVISDGADNKTVCPSDTQAIWSVQGLQIEYCLAERVEEHCKLLFSVTLATVVTISNFLKLVLFVLSLYITREPPILNVGDAISSFTQRADVHTEGMCMLARDDFVDEKTPWQHGTGARHFFADDSRKWSSAASKRRWVISNLLFAVAIFICLMYWLIGLTHLTVSYGFHFPFTIGFGAVDVRTLLRWDFSGIVGNVLAANAAQAVLSLLYVAYNSLISCLFVAYEWHQYSRYRKGLRVSSRPRGAQRSTYFLQIPYRFAIPIQVVWAGLHYLVSQAIYLVSIEAFSTVTEPPPSPNNIFSVEPDHSSDILTCGYSPLGITCIISLLLLAVLILFILSKKEFPPGMPVAGSCSAAIAAACHARDGEPEDGVEKKVKWGDVNEKGPVGHCAFSGWDVGELKHGRVYAGKISGS